MKLSAAVEEYKLCYWREGKGHAKSTRYLYLGRLTSFLKWCQQSGLGDPSVQEITPQVLRRYRTYVMDTEVSSNTVRSHIHAIRYLMGFLHRDGVIAEDPSHRDKLPGIEPGQRTIISEEDLYRLLEATDRQITEFRRKRDKALMCVLVFCCLRRQECLDVRTSHLNLEDQTLRVQCGKGRKDRDLPLPPEAVAALQAWLEIRGVKKHNYLFTTLDGRRLGENGLPVILEQAVRIANLKVEGKVTAHCLRHAGATRWYRLTKDLLAVKTLLGHEDLKTTEIYLRAHEQDIRYLAELGSSQQSESSLMAPQPEKQKVARKDFFSARRRSVR